MLKKLVMCSLLIGLAVPACDKTTVEGPQNKKLTLINPASVTVTRGDTAKVSLVVTRQNFDGPVKVEFDKLPKGVSVVDDRVTIEENERTFVLEATKDAPLVSNHVAHVILSGPDGMTATGELKITVRGQS